MLHISTYMLALDNLMNTRFSALAGAFIPTASRVFQILNSNLPTYYLKMYQTEASQLNDYDQDS